MTSLFSLARNRRLPTLEEAMSLMEPTEKSSGMHIDPVFDNIKMDMDIGHE